MPIYGTLATSQGFTIQTSSGEPLKTPSGLLVTRAVETKAGWVGQIILDKTIVWESEGFTGDEYDAHKEATGDEYDAHKEATRAANERVISRLASLFGDEVTS